MRRCPGPIGRCGALALAVMTTGCAGEVDNPFDSQGSSSTAEADGGTTEGGEDTTTTGTSTGAQDTEALDDTDSTGEVTDSTSRGDTTGASTGDTGTSSGSGSSSDGTTGTTGDPPQTCPDDSYNAVPTNVSDSTADLDDLFDASCGGSGAPDAAYEFTAPAADLYRFTTTGSALDTIVYVLDGSCDGQELACSDDCSTFDTSSSVVVDLAADQTVTVVVDSFAIAGGSFNLSIDACGATGCVAGPESCG